MADWQIVSLQFTDQVPNEGQLKLIEDRLEKFYHKPYGNVPAGAEMAVTHFGDYDFPGFDRNPIGLNAKSWREPLDIDLFRHMLHYLGFANKCSHYSERERENDDEFCYPPWEKSNPEKLTGEEKEMLRKLFPELFPHLVTCRACGEVVSLIPVETNVMATIPMSADGTGPRGPRETGLQIFKLGDGRCPMPRCEEVQSLPQKAKA